MSLLTRLFITLIVGISVPAMANETLSIDALLNAVKQGQKLDQQGNAQREKSFDADQATQQRLLTQMKNQRAEQETLSAQLESQFETNDTVLNQLREELATELGDLKELLGSLQQSVGEAQVNLDGSLVSAQLPGRAEQMQELAAKMAASDGLISMQEIESVWYTLLQEMSEQGKVTRFKTDVILPNGESHNREVIRVGVFNAVTGGQFLRYQNQQLLQLPRQPQARLRNQAQDLQNSQTVWQRFPLDPSQGQLLSAIVDSPSISERIRQGGTVGYLILLLGMVALVLASYKLIMLALEQKRVKQQMQRLDQSSANNVLGRILQVPEQHPSTDLESLELRLGEAILKETPKLNAGLMFLKIIAVVAPLMGLLGTVTGMIVTFQSITLFGTGDPKLMAGGISQALVTTVLGLCVAIPTVLLHTAASSRAKRLQEILEEQSVGLIAQRAEFNDATSAT